MDDMKAGTELDVEVAQKVFGWRYCEVVGAPRHPTSDGGSERLSQILVTPKSEAGRLPPYSTDISAAWEVLEALKPLWPEQTVTRGLYTINSDFWEVTLEEAPDGYKRVAVEAETAPLAICLAALKAAAPPSEPSA